MARSVELGGRGSRFIVLASVCLVVAALYFGREVLVPIALAILFSFLLTPPVRWLERLRLPRGVATMIVVLVAVTLFVSLGYVVGRQFKSVLEQLPRYQGELQKKVAGLRSHGGFFRQAEEEIHAIGKATASTSQPAQGGHPPAAEPPPPTNPMNLQSVAEAAMPGHARPTTAPSTENPIPVRIVPAEPTAVQLLEEYATSFLSPMATALLVLILVIFMLLTSEDLRDRIIRLVGHGRVNLTTQALDDAGQRISRYLGALAIVNTGYGVAVASGLWVIGHFLGHGTNFPNVLVWGLLVGLFRFVPYVGIWIGASVPLLLSFALFPGSGVFFGVVGLFIALEVIVGQFIEPYWYGASTGMSALAVLVAAIFWTWLWGGIGLLLSTPLTVCLVVMGKYVPQLQFLDILLGDEPVLPPHMRLYQRLIAADEEEATDLAREMLKDHTLEQVYDDVLLPALAAAEHDHHRQRLGPERLGVIRQSMRDIAEELGEDAFAKRVRQAAAETEQAAKDQSPAKDLPKPRPPLPKDCVVKVVTLPAKTESDEIVAIMLTQLLTLRGYCATSVGVDLLASEMVETIEKDAANIVCVSAMPPAAVPHARYLCKRIHARFPEMTMAIGVWHTKTDPQKIKQRIACDETVRIVTSLGQAQEQIDQLAHPFISAASESGQPAATR